MSLKTFIYISSLTSSKMVITNHILKSGKPSYFESIVHSNTDDISTELFANLM